MIDEAELEGLDPFALFDVESARVERHFRQLDDAGWTLPTRCEGWRNREMLSHVRGVELYNEACVNDATDALMQRASAEGGVSDVDSFNTWVNTIYAGHDTNTLLDEWYALCTAWIAEMRRRGPAGELSTMVGPYPVRLQVFHLAMEYATHADDMDVPIPESERYKRLGWRLAFSNFVLRELDKPVTLHAADGHTTVTLNDTPDGESIELSDHDLVEAGQGRLAPGTLPEKFDAALRTL